ncbi:MAG TPA: PQQ-dependent sugar dehydrogenase [Deinococcales bacterium]|nr:PQQ-dependent sugar dehydrogenase [Deinococcales bacterium]
MRTTASVLLTALLATGGLISCNTSTTPPPDPTPTQPTETTLQAETLTLAGNATVVSDTGAQEGNAVDLKHNGDGVSVTLPDTFGEGTYTLGLVADGTDVEGAPNLSVTVDGQPAGQQVITSSGLSDTPVQGALLSLKAGSVVNVKLINAYTLPDGVPTTTGQAKERAARLDALHFTPASAAPAYSVAAGVNPDKAVEVFKSRQDGLNYPSAISFLPGGDLLVLERFSGGPSGEATGPARLKRISMTDGSIHTVSGLPVTADSPSAAGNGGAISLDVDPNFASNGKLYICYTYATDATTGRADRASSLVYNPVTDSLSGEVALIDNIPSGPYYHNGCSIRYGVDGKVYVATGDADTSYDSMPDAQNPSNLAGKILRVNPDGSVPSDNPTPGSVVWNLGHRNPQGLAFQPGTTNLWGAEHGQNTRDELNILLPAKNYGWPYCAGKQPYGTIFNDPDIYGGDPTVRPRVRDCTDQGDHVLTAANYMPAVQHFGHDPATEDNMGSSMAPSNISFYTGDRFPAWKNDILMAFLKASTILRLHVTQTAGTWSVAEETPVVDKTTTAYSDGQLLSNRLRQAITAPDGTIYAITNVESQLGNGTDPRGSMIIRIRPK